MEDGLHGREMPASGQATVREAVSKPGMLGSVRRARRACGGCWTGVAAWGRVAPQGCPGGKASGRAAWEGCRGVPCQRTANTDLAPPGRKETHTKRVGLWT